MKKLFCFLAIAATAAFTSCSSDDDSGNNDNGGGGDVVTGITLTSSSSTVTLGNAFTFTVKNNLNEDVTAASTIYVDDTALEGNTYTATEAGTYTVHATNGDFTSADVTVTVTEDTIVITSLSVGYDVQVVNVNETITFTATANGDMDVTADAVFYVNGTEIEGNTFSTDAVGAYQITASYEDYTTDAENDEEYAVVAFMDAVTFTETEVNNSALVYFGRVELTNGGFADYFSIISYEGTDALTDVQTDNYLDVEVLVAVEQDDEVTFPSADNANFYQIYELVKGGVNYPILSIESGSVTEATGLVADSETATFNIQSAFNGNISASTINLNYNGAFDNYYDQSEQAGEGRGVTLTLENIRASRTKKFSSK